MWPQVFPPECLPVAAVLGALLIVAAWRLVCKDHNLELARTDRDIWINIAADFRRDGGAYIKRMRFCYEDDLRTLDKVDEYHKGGHAYRSGDH